MGDISSYLMAFSVQIFFYGVEQEIFFTQNNEGRRMKDGRI